MIFTFCLFSSLFSLIQHISMRFSLRIYLLFIITYLCASSLYSELLMFLILYSQFSYHCDYILNAFQTFHILLIFSASLCAFHFVIFSLCYSLVLLFSFSFYPKNVACVCLSLLYIELLATLFASFLTSLIIAASASLS